MRNPVVSDSEVYEIKKLRWEELSPNSFWTKKPDGNLINVYRNPDTKTWWATNTDKSYRCKQSAIKDSERWYRQQLRKALRRARR